MKKINLKNKIYYLYFLIIAFLPSTVLAAWTPGDPIVPDCTKTPPDSMCHFNDALLLIDNVLQVFIWVSVPIATLLFAWIGWIFITSSDKPGARNDAKKKLEALGKGLFFILGSWLIINTLVGLLIDPSFGAPTELLNN